VGCLQLSYHGHRQSRFSAAWRVGRPRLVRLHSLSYSRVGPPSQCPTILYQITRAMPTNELDALLGISTDTQVEHRLVSTALLWIHLFHVLFKWTAGCLEKNWTSHRMERSRVFFLECVNCWLAGIPSSLMAQVFSTFGMNYRADSVSVAPTNVSGVWPRQMYVEVRSPTSARYAGLFFLADPVGSSAWHFPGGFLPAATFCCSFPGSFPATFS
jgi:hypothetical protein